jgi:CheY-like chemotaxis protein
MNKPKVLLVDDDRSVLDALGAVIESEGFELVRAADGHEAVENFRQQPIDIVLLDLNMPGHLSASHDHQSFAADCRYHSAVGCLSGRDGEGRRRADAEAAQHPIVARSHEGVARRTSHEALSRVAGHAPQTRKI